MRVYFTGGYWHVLNNVGVLMARGQHLADLSEAIKTGWTGRD